VKTRSLSLGIILFLGLNLLSFGNSTIELSESDFNIPTLYSETKVFEEINNYSGNILNNGGLFINFEDEGITNNYEFSKFSFEKSQKSFSGNYSAKVFTKYHGISIVLPKGFFASKVVGSVISIHISFCPTRLENNSYLFRLKSVNFDEDKEISAVIKNETVNVRVKNIFIDSETGDKKDIIIPSYDKVNLNNWSEISIVFDLLKSKILLYLNNEIISFAKVEGTRMEIGNDNFSLEIGSDFVGYIDDFALVPYRLTSTKSIQEMPSEIVSRIIDTKNYSSELVNVKLNKKIGDFLVYARGSNNIGDLINNKTEWQLFQGEGIKARYIQVKLIPLKKEGDIKSFKVSLTTETDIKPLTPQIVDIKSQNQGEVTISWQNDLDDEISYYEVYYGTEKDKYFGTDALNGPSPIKVKKPTKFYPVYNYTLKGLKLNETYYISMRSVRKDGTKSDYSEEIKFTPGILFLSRK